MCMKVCCTFKLNLDKYFFYTRINQTILEGIKLDELLNTLNYLAH